MIINLGSNGGGGGSYTLPIASENRLGGIKVGENLTIDENGVLSSEASASVVKLTQAQYDALEEKDENTTYVITDSSAIDMDSYDNIIDCNEDGFPEEGESNKLYRFGNKIYKYNESGYTWGEWKGYLIGKFPSSEFNDTLKYDYIPQEMHHNLLARYRYNTISSSRIALYLYFDLDDDRILVYSAETETYTPDFTATPFDTVSKGQTKTWSFGLGNSSFEWSDGYFKFYNSSYNYTDQRCSVTNNNGGFENINDFKSVISTSGTGIPYWNETGEIIGKNMNVNHSSFQFNKPASSNNRIYYLRSDSAQIPDFYAPVSAGTQGQILKSNGGGAPTWINSNTITGGLTMVCLTQDEYDALVTHDPSTLYIIKEDE